MATHKLEGIVIRYQNFGEADRMITLFTSQKGKVRALAKGVRRLTSRKGGNIELLNHGYFYIAEGRTLDIITEVLIENTHQTIKSDLECTSLTYLLMELIEAVTVEEQQNTSLYNSFIKLLGLLNTVTLSSINREFLILRFEIILLRDLGLWSLDEIVRLYALTDIQKSIVFSIQDPKPIANYNVDLKSNDFRRVRESIENFIAMVIEKQLRSANFIKEVKRVSPKRL